MSLIVKYSTGSTYTLVANKVESGIAQDISSYHVPLTNINGGVRQGLKAVSISISGDIEDRTACLWHDIVAVSLDSGTSYQTVYFASVSFSDDRWSSIYPFSLELLASPLREGTAVRYPTSATAWYWGDVASDVMHQHGNVNTYPIIHYLAPLLYAPLTADLFDITGQAVTLTRAAAKVHGGVNYAINTPIFDNGLYLASDTSTDVGKITFAAATVRTVMCQVKKTYAAGGDHLTLWTAAKNKLTIDCQAGTDTISWTDDTTTVTATFPSSDWDAGTVINIVAIDGASHAVTLAVQAAGGAWETHTGTLAAIAWPELTLGPLEGSLANLVCYPYALTSSEYQAADYSALALKYDNLTIANKYAGEIVKGSDGRLVNADGDDISALLGGVDTAIGATPVTITQSQGLSARWYVELKQTDV